MGGAYTYIDTYTHTNTHIHLAITPHTHFFNFSMPISIRTGVGFAGTNFFAALDVPNVFLGDQVIKKGYRLVNMLVKIFVSRDV